MPIGQLNPTNFNQDQATSVCTDPSDVYENYFRSGVSLDQSLFPRARLNSVTKRQSLSTLANHKALRWSSNYTIMYSKILEWVVYYFQWDFSLFWPPYTQTPQSMH